MYEGLKRSDNAAAFPRHVFTRGANLHSNIQDRIGDREDVFKTTLVHLTERFNGKEVFLVGSMNQSTMLAQRTEKLIQELRPDEVMVQTSSEWWEAARSLQYVDSQEEFNDYGADLEKFEQKNMFDFYSATRKLVF
jgi:hypothetical protein